MPDFNNTIADFRRDNGAAIVRVCRKFFLLCRKMQRLGDATVAIDGSKFKAVNNRNKNFTNRKLAARLVPVEQSIAYYLDELDRAVQQAAEVAAIPVPHPKITLATGRIDNAPSRLPADARQVDAQARCAQLIEPARPRSAASSCRRRVRAGCRGAGPA